MEKYGVQEDTSPDKKASPVGTCPICGAPLEKTASVHKCPTHGTKPFEKKDEGQNGKT